MRKRGMKYNTTKILHPWVVRDYRPHSNFVIVKPEFVDEITARLLLLGYKRSITRNLYSIKLHIMDHHEDGFYALYMDNNNEWVLTRNPLRDLGI